MLHWQRLSLNQSVGVGIALERPMRLKGWNDLSIPQDIWDAFSQLRDALTHLNGLFGNRSANLAVCIQCGFALC